MSIRLNIGDAVLVQMKKNEKIIGLIKYVGPMVDDMLSEYVGIELIKPIEYGHDGTVNGFAYFTAQNGYGFHCKLINIIRKLKPSELITKLRDLHILLKLKTQYIQKIESIMNKNKPQIPSKVKTSLTEMGEMDEEKYIMPKRHSLDSKISITDSITHTKNEIKQITRIHPLNRVRNSTSVTEFETNSLSMSRTHTKLTDDHTDHELSLSSESNNSNPKIYIKKSQPFKNKKYKIKRKGKSISKESNSSNSDLPMPHSDDKINIKSTDLQSNICLKQSHTKIFGGNINISYNKQSLKKSVVYVKNLPSLSELSKSPKSPSNSSPKRIGLGYFGNKSKQ